ncbi:MAG: FecCD family ABC transporter permease [Hyphomicrobiaceae bacterium]
MKYPALLTALLLGLGVAFMASLLVGPAALSFSTSVAALFGGGNEAAILVMQEIRLPRALLGAMIGATLGLSGAVLQGFLRNPLADPGILGISSSAAFGAVLAIYTGLSALTSLAVPIAGMGGAVAAVVLLLTLTGRHAGTLTLILAGVALSSLSGALTALALNLSSNPFAALEIVFWMLGSLTDRSFVHVAIAAPFMLIGWLLLFSVGRALDALTLGAEVAATLGARVRRVRTLAIWGTAVSVGAATSVAGSIGFVGLIVPHLLRPLVGQTPSRLLPVSAAGGAILVLIADVAVRVIAPGRDIKLGVLTAIVGAPFFVWLVVKTRREEL